MEEQEGQTLGMHLLDEEDEEWEPELDWYEPPGELSARTFAYHWSGALTNCGPQPSKFPTCPNLLLCTNRSNRPRLRSKKPARLQRWRSTSLR